MAIACHKFAHKTIGVDYTACVLLSYHKHKVELLLHSMEDIHLIDDCYIIIPFHTTNFTFMALLLTSMETTCKGALAYATTRPTRKSTPL